MKIKLLLLLVGLTILSKYCIGQQSSSYKMDFVRACIDSSNGKKVITAVFSVRPTVKKFKLILSMKVTYAIQNGKDTINVLKQNDDNIQISIYGKDSTNITHKTFYDFIKGKVNLNTKDDLRFIVFRFNNVTQDYINKMSITYGLWESNNSNERNETKYEFGVEPCH
jgi:hypothetical protein